MENYDDIISYELKQISKRKKNFRNNEDKYLYEC